jgi:hypothetical protein
MVPGGWTEETMQQTPKTQWKALYSAFRSARHELTDVREDGWTVLPHSDVAAVHAAATAVSSDCVRGGFALRHAPKLGAVWHGAEAARRAWIYVAPGAAATLPRYVRGMIQRSPRIQAGGYRSRWQPRYARTVDVEAPEELPPPEPVGVV